jgi:hypothetical protein
MPKRSDILKKAETLEGLPWHPSGSSEETGVNCIGLMVVLAKRLRLQKLQTAFKPYVGMTHEGERKGLLKLLRKHMEHVAPVDAQPGDLLLVKMRGRNPRDPELTHVALSLQGGMILEALETNTKMHTGKVRRILNPYKVHSAWRVPNLKEE